MGGYHSGIGGFFGGGYRNPNSQVYGSADQGANTIQARADSLSARIAQQNAFITALQAQYEALNRPVENEGIKLGEIIGWRAWTVHKGWLYSMVNENAEWRPGRVMEAHKVGIPVGEGIHAFKTRRQAIQTYGGSPHQVVIGEVALWGDIVEFEKGWHAEFASIYSLDLLTGDPYDRGTELAELQEIYKVRSAT